MSDYAIGDVHGCYEPLMRLLDSVKFDDKIDRLWFVGDLVNRGPHSLKVLRFIQGLYLSPQVVLGNHDLYLLACIFRCRSRKHNDDTLHAVIDAPDAEEIGHWLRQQPLIYHDQSLNVVIAHAGIAPIWSLPTAKKLSAEVSLALSGPDYLSYLTHMFGNDPYRWSTVLTVHERLRLITNYFTRMRFCYNDGALALAYKAGLSPQPSDITAWFDVPSRVKIDATIIFGHWAALQGKCPVTKIYAIDTGCVWGGRLTALCLQNKTLVSVPGLC